jgi:hypothetical protein
MRHDLIVADLGQAVARLEAALRSPADTDLLRAGCIQVYNAEQARDVYDVLPTFLAPLRQLADRLANGI